MRKSLKNIKGSRKALFLVCFFAFMACFGLAFADAPVPVSETIVSPTSNISMETAVSFDHLKEYVVGKNTVGKGVLAKSLDSSSSNQGEWRKTSFEESGLVIATLAFSPENAFDLEAYDSCKNNLCKKTSFFGTIICTFNAIPGEYYFEIIPEKQVEKYYLDVDLVEGITGQGIPTAKECNQNTFEEKNAVVGYYILDIWGGVHAVGNVPEFETPYIKGGSAVAFALAPGMKGGYLLEESGKIHTIGTAQKIPSNYVGPYARDLELYVENGKVVGYYALNNWGQIKTFGSAPKISSKNISFNGCAEKLVVWKQDLDTKYCILTGHGVVYCFEEESRKTESFYSLRLTRTADIARGFAVNPKTHEPEYVLDKLGNIHKTETAEELAKPPQFDSDIINSDRTRDLIIVYGDEEQTKSP